MIRVLLFAALREAAGREQIEVPAEAGCSARLLFERLVVEYPQIGPYASRTRVAVNNVHATWDTPVRDEDEVVFFPPVSGGCH